MKNKAIHILYLFLLSHLALGQSSSADSLNAVLKTLPDGNEKIEVLNQLFKLAMNSDAEEAKKYCFQVVDMSKKVGNNLALASAYKDMGVVYLIASSFDSAKYYNQLALQEFEKLRSRNGKHDKSKVMEGYAGTICNIGNWHYYQSAIDSAIKYHLLAIELSEQFGVLKPKANSLGTLAFIYMDQAKYDQALAMHFEALHTFEKLENLDGIARSYQGIGEINCDYLKKCDLALDYYQKSLAIKKRIGSERGMTYSLIRIGSAYEKLSKLDSANYYYEKTIALAKKLDDKRVLVDGYSALASIAEEMGKSDEERIRINQQFIEIANEIGRVDGIYIGYWNLGSIYEQQGDFEKAISYYEKANPLAQEQKDYRLLEKINYGLYSNYKDHRHDPSKALAALEAYLVSHDSVTNADRFRAVEDISTQYETEKKEATIKQQDQALQLGRIRFWLIAGILALALVGGAVLFRLTRQLRKRNEEKEFLIKEIHHRVKNNLQVLSSLLHLQSRHIKDETALDAVREGQNRVEAMGLIHQKLYMGDNLAAVEMRDYLHNLGDTLLDSFGLEERVKISYDLEPMRLDVDTAIPLGLIINELVTNSLKYAFPNGGKGEIAISLWKDEAGKLCLKVADNGVGKANAPALKNSTSFGSNLVEMLSKKLKGKPEVTDAQGYSTLIQFENFKEAK